MRSRHPEHTVAALGHVATRRQLVERGFTGFDLTSAVRAGRLRRVRRGWYATADATSDQLTAVRVGGRLSHASAARSYGLWAGVDARVHVTVTRGASRLRRRRTPTFDTVDLWDSEVCVHWTRPGRQDLTSTQTWRVDLAECLLGAVVEMPLEHAVACLDTARSVYGESVLVPFSLAEPRHRRVAALSRPGSESGLESIVRQRLGRLGLDVQQQVSIAGVGRVDMVVEGLVVIEVDGWEFHKDAFERDHRRSSTLMSLGRFPLSFTYAQVMDDWPFVERTILDTVAMSQNRNMGPNRAKKRAKPS